jgi:hypothetical protein
MPPATATAPAAPAAKPAVVKKSAPAAAPAKPAATKPAAATAPAAAGAEKPKKAPPKSPASATEDEINAAVLGELNPRSTKGTADQEGLTKKTESGRNSGRPLGVTTGFPILLAWCWIFQQNDKAPDNPVKLRDGKPVVGTGKMTDEQISAWMKSEFPGRDTPAFDHPQGCRRDYNNGKFTKLQKPKIESQRYGPDAAVIGPRAGRAGKNEGTPAPAPGNAPAKAAVAKPAAPKQVAKA